MALRFICASGQRRAVGVTRRNDPVCCAVLKRFPYCTAQEETVEYPKVRNKWPPGIRGVKKPKIAWEIYEHRCELEKINNARVRLEWLAGTFTETESSFMVLSTPYNMYPKTLKHHQYTTKTEVIENQLPPIFSKLEVSHIVQEIKPLVLDSLQSLFQTSKKYDPNITGKPKNSSSLIGRSDVIGAVVYALIAGLSADNQHLMRAQIDENCRLETFWKRTGYDVKKLNLNRGVIGSREYGNILRFQFQHRVDLQIRTELPLPEFVLATDDICFGESIDYVYAPPKMGERTVDGRPTSVSGVWINDPCEFTTLSVHCLGDKFSEFKQFFAPAVSEYKTTVAFYTGFGSCVAQAHNQGFNWLMNITYPFTTQTVVFDGENLRFCAYQLNTLDLWQHDAANKKRNLAWVSDDIRLFGGVEDGRVVGLNDDALAMLTKTLLLEPTDRGIDLRPFLPKHEAPRLKKKFFNHVGEKVWEEKKIGRFEFPPNAVYHYSSS